VVARQLVAGYTQAVGRFSVGVRETDSNPAYFALFESLNWAVAIDDFVREVWVPHGEPLDRGWTDLAAGDGYVDLLDGARYARNLVHHHWADALRSEQARATRRRTHECTTRGSGEAPTICPSTRAPPRRT
jgi:hypothetical protein